ncbi:MAG: glycosyltransferase family 4 protein [Desulfarculus sp.]|nr:glycosyltransferase family 4 protein [Desulfarculus sp.]
MRWALYNLTTTTQGGGVEMSVWALGRELARRGHEVTIMGGQSKRPLPALAQGLGVRAFAFTPRERFPDLGTRARKLMERLSFARQALPDLRAGGFERLLIFKSYDLAPALWAARGRGMRVGFLSGGSEFYPGYATLARRLDYLGAVSAFTAGQMHMATGLTPLVNHLGVDFSLFRPAEPDPELAQACGMEPGDETLVAAVRLVALKGVQRAINALAILRDRRPHLKLLVAGEGPYRQELERRAQQAGVAGRVRLLGFLPPERLAGFYALGRVAVFPSMGEEALGLSIAEAMACGLPVVASRLGGVPEVVADCGLLVPPKDDQALAQALEGLLDDPARRADLAARGRERVAREFTWPACVARLEEGLS